MQIINARLGHANNSSSSHSMIVLSKDRAAGISEDETGDYGWSDFTLTEPDSKLDYVATAIFQQLFGQSSNELTATLITQQVLGLPATWGPKNSIDHQSTFDFPASESGALIDVGFARAFAAWVQSPQVVILGGNDNGDGHPLASEGTDAMPFGRESANPFVARFDEASGSWTLFNKQSGAKLRLAFSEEEAPELKEITPSKNGKKGKVSSYAHDSAGKEPPALKAPELVDLKITDFCDIGCSWCYQGSTVKGAHASMDSIRQVARQLAKSAVLEVAIGGGEPTRHPDFVEILKTFSALGINANFTTRDLSFLDDESRALEIFGNSRSIAYSVNSVAQIEKANTQLEEFKKKHKFHHSGFSFQYVIGTSTDEEFSRILQMSVKNSIKLTLLGYKDAGRGAQWRESAEGKSFMLREAKVQQQGALWLPILQKALGTKSYALVSIDTALARESEGLFEKFKIPRHMWHKSEGSVSMYIDATSMRMSPSSYTDSSESVPFDAKWIERFKGFNSTATPSARKKGVPSA